MRALSPSIARWVRAGSCSLAVFAMLAVPFAPVPSAEAATMTNLGVYLNRQEANVPSGTSFDFFFAPVTPLTGGSSANSLRVLMPDGDDTAWCRTAGTITVTGISNTNGETLAATPLPGTLTGTCAQGVGAGATEANRDRLLVTGVDDIAVGTLYGLRIAEGSAALGTATAVSSTVQLLLRTRDASYDVDQGTFPVLALNSTDQVTVTATVPSATPPEQPQTAITLKGIAYPSSTVTILKNGVIAAQVPADPQARFDVTVGSLLAGSYTMGVYGTDAAGLDGPTSNFTVTLTTGTTVTISGIFLGPTITADKTAIKPGETITLLGTTSPSSAVHVYVSSTVEKQFDTQSTGAGAWSRKILASDLNAGTHTARSKAVEPGGDISAFSDTVTFTVASTTPTGPTYIRADINQDGKVDLIDFSILLYYWNQRNPTNPRADINQDSTVNIIDFSIMLFYWTAKPV
jgi:hypothetical protein